jgi:hypothetical protein
MGTGSAIRGYWRSMSSVVSLAGRDKPARRVLLDRMVTNYSPDSDLQTISIEIGFGNTADILEAHLSSALLRLQLTMYLETLDNQFLGCAS